MDVSNTMDRLTCIIFTLHDDSYKGFYSFRWHRQKSGEVGRVVVFVSSLSNVLLFATPWTAAQQASLSFTISRSLLKLMSIELVMPSNPSHLLSSPSSPAFSLSQHQGLFKWASCLHEVAKVLELQLQCKSLWWIFRKDAL